ncbi:SDR family oxidoreductase [Pontibacter sp. G13]|uniref:NAD(P)-dependent oxidoreductase n=1 Tax=Pontibacter sp. G13 TaxID=3074898 RepID=UPI00288B95E1|nr:SDR family oxidoreductase [Pontibacter sp. G13]WNJ19257.1 SDR family oxidoreductase [Pontibacter sp. G13]
MRILIIGATGRLGTQLVQLALEQGHEVIAFAPNIHTLDIEDPKLVIAQGDVMNKSRLNWVFSVYRPEAVVSVFGIRQFRGTITLLSEGTRNIIEAMETHGLNRFVTITGAGILQESEQALIMDSLSFPPNLQNVSLDHRRLFEALRESTLDWTIVSPAFMKFGEPTGQYIVRADFYPQRAQNEVTVSDVADFIVKELDTNEYIGHRVGIAAPIA